FMSAQRFLFLLLIPEFYTFPQEYHTPEKYQECKQNENVGRNSCLRLPEWRRNDQFYLCTIGIPHAIVIRCPHSEYIFSRIEIGIGRFPFLARCAKPGFIKSFKLIFVLVFLRMHIIQSGELECDHILK